jgi:hypothetical protein
LPFGSNIIISENVQVTCCPACLLACLFIRLLVCALPLAVSPGATVSWFGNASEYNFSL